MRRRSLVSVVGMIITIGVVGCGDAGGDSPAADSPAAMEPTTSTPVPTPATPPVATDTPAPAPAAPAAAAPTGGSDPQLVQAGQQVFAGPGLCTACHGPNAQGTALAPNLTDGTWLWIENPEENLQQKVADLVRAGVPQPQEAPAPMPPMGGANLSDDQLNAVAAYVASISG